MNTKITLPFKPGAASFKRLLGGSMIDLYFHKKHLVTIPRM